MLRENYAFPQMRDIQVEVIERIEEAFKTKKFVMLEAPTGTGKSGIIMSAALQLGESYINTSSKLLQDQYLRDFPYIKTIKGKNNFECINPDEDERFKGKLTCDKGECCFDSKYICIAKPKKENFIAINRGTRNERINQKLMTKIDVTGNEEFIDSCHYFSQKMAGFAAGHTILNYKYFLSMVFYNADDMNSRKLLVFDEAHNIENEILDFISITPNPEKYNEYYLTLVKSNEELADNIPFTPYPVDDKVESWIEYLKGTNRWMEESLKYYEDVIKLPYKIKKAISQMEGTQQKISHIISIMEQKKENWVIDMKTYMGQIQSVKISPIEIGEYVRPIFDFGDKVLLTSATLLDRDVFCDMVGVKPDEVEFIRIDQSPFPKENRPIYLRNVGEMNYKTMDSLMPKVVADIDRILAIHSTERGIIHTTSYKQLDYIMKNSKWSYRLIKTEAGIPQSDILRKHAISGEDGVLISPSMKEGVDLKDDLSRFQIVVKIPYSDLSDKRTSVKMRRSYNWYMWHTVLAFVQQIGRSIRNEKDYAATYVLDSKAGQIVNNKFMPFYIRQAIIR